jgi:hypothetical protein
MRVALFLCLLGAAASAQDPPNIYTNRELKLRFSGVFGWQVQKADAGGAWSLLARYDQPAYDATVLLQTRPNVFASFEAFQNALREEFPVAPEGAEPQPDKPVLRQVTYRDVEMRGGVKLPGVQVEATALQITTEGKRREQSIQVCTFFGKNRLFRVHCSVQRARHAKVKDLFDRAIESLEVAEQGEAAQRGMPFRSWDGGYACLVPDGFQANVGGSRALDAWFENKRLGVVVSVVSYRTDGDLRAHLDKVAEYYGDALSIEKEETALFGTGAFLATAEREGKLLRMVGTVWRGRAIRVLAEGKKENAAEVTRVFDSFLKDFKLQ